MKKIKVNNWEELLAQVKNYTEANKARVMKVYRLSKKWKKNFNTNKEQEPRERIGVKLNKQVDICIEERKSSEASKKLGQLFVKLQKEIDKVITNPKTNALKANNITPENNSSANKQTYWLVLISVLVVGLFCFWYWIKKRKK